MHFRQGLGRYPRVGRQEFQRIIQMKFNEVIKMKKVLLCMVFSLMSFAVLAQSAGQAQPLDKIVAVINSDVVTNSELQKQINIIKQQAQSANAPLPDDATIRKQVLDQLINQKLLMILAKRNKLEIDDQQLNSALSNIAARNNITLAQLPAVVAKQGISYADFREQIRSQMMVQQVEQHALGASLVVTDQEVKNYLKQHPNSNASYDVQDILIPLNSSPSAQDIATAQKKATDLMQQLNAAGADQSKILSAQNIEAADLGWRNLNDLPTIFAGRVATMKTGEVAGPVRAPNGFHILKLAGVKSTGQPLTVNQVRQILFQGKAQAAIPPWLKQLRATAYVKIMD